ncbi:uncharacterized protein DSM5745_09320 [Aspergillus mulundensis]|uniref:Arrestin-like N-terminal domain-containing protein n=1 Tax=Aspergillus mulundensis TaxID=1810919 RepID=A0A3D8R0U5_9EURO|nr:hypothetical protein DSM5745_09320 [Aspergillus mulundensis]RDW67454.1 hypothetical protein DSM5745_09320 [Aspergillus mulundensis]
MVSAVGVHARSWCAYHKRRFPRIDIELDYEILGKMPRYTTGDTVRGAIKISGSSAVSFDKLDIKLEGVSMVLAARDGLLILRGASQKFLQLHHPFEPSADSTHVMPDHPYNIRFEFAIPPCLLPDVCVQEKKNPSVERSHTLLPPSLHNELGKRSSEACCITYHICVDILRRRQDGLLESLGRAKKRITITPDSNENPPMLLEPNIPHPQYRICQEKTVKAGAARRDIGRLVVAASQPTPICLGTPARGSLGSKTTVYLRFDPLGDNPPPALHCVSTKLRVATYYSVSHFDEYPDMLPESKRKASNIGLNRKTVALQELCISSVQWTRHTTGLDDNLPDTSTVHSSPESPASLRQETYYSAAVVVPLTLPDRTPFIPTFHSCLISRVYAVQIDASYRARDRSVRKSTVSLRIPIQLINRQISSRDDGDAPL